MHWRLGIYLYIFVLFIHIYNIFFNEMGVGAVAQPVERATPVQEVVDSIAAPGARTLLTRSLSVFNLTG